MPSTRAIAPLPYSQKIELEQAKQLLKQAQAELMAVVQQLHTARKIETLPAITHVTVAHIPILSALHQFSLQLRQEETDPIDQQDFKQGLDSLAWCMASLQYPDLIKNNPELAVLKLGIVPYEPAVLTQPSAYHVKKMQALIRLFKQKNDVTKLSEKVNELTIRINELSEKHSLLKRDYQARNSEENKKFPTRHVPKKFKYTLVEDNDKKTMTASGYSAFVTHTTLADRKTPYVLDAEFQLGSAGATTDGLGELPDEAGNMQIARAAYFAAKYLTNYSHQYSTPDALYKALPLLIQQTGEVTRQKCAGSDAASAIVFTHAYYYHHNKIKVVAAGVGDCMALIWRPQQQKIIPLLTARQFHNGFQFNPVSITDMILPEEAVQITQVQINEEDVIIRMTDGIWELLPYYFKSTNNYLEYFPDTAKLNALFSEFYMHFVETENRAPTADDYQNFLAAHIQTQAKARYELLQGENGLVRVLSNELEKLNPQLTVLTCLQNWKTSHSVLAEKLAHYLDIAAYVTDAPAFGEFTVAELIKHLQQPVQIGDDATCSIHLVTKNTCTVVKNPLIQPFKALHSFLRGGS